VAHTGTDGNGGGGSRRWPLIVLILVAALGVFAVGFALGAQGNREAAPPPSSQGPATSSAPTPSRSPSPVASPTVEPSTGAIGDGRYFVRLTDVQGGEEGPLLLQYDLAYLLTGDAANQAAAAHGDETPVPNDYYIVNDNPKLRLTPLSDLFVVRYLPEGSGTTTPVPGTHDRFFAWMGQTAQTDFPTKAASWWWITIQDGQVVKIEQQFFP
jgi:hypothetical protein